MNKNSVTQHKGWDRDRVKMARSGGILGERKTRGFNDTGSKDKKDDMERKVIPKEYHCWSSSKELQGGVRQRGVMTLVHKSIATRVRKEDVIKDKEGRYLVVPVATLEKGQTLWLINVYAPASQSEKGQVKQRGQEEPETGQGKEEQQEEREERELRREKTRFYTETLGRLTEEIDKARTPRDVLIVGMDANIVMQGMVDVDWERKQEGEHLVILQRLERESQLLRGWANKLAVTDVWRLQHPLVRQYSRRVQEAGAEGDLSKRLDMILVSQEYANTVRKTSITPIEEQAWVSDHDMIEIE